MWSPLKLGESLFVMGMVLYFGGTFAIGFVFLLLLYFHRFPENMDVGVTWILTTLAWWGIAVILMILGALFFSKKKKELERALDLLQKPEIAHNPYSERSKNDKSKT